MVLCDFVSIDICVYVSRKKSESAKELPGAARHADPGPRARSVGTPTAATRNGARPNVLPPRLTKRSYPFWTGTYVNAWLATGSTRSRIQMARIVAELFRLRSRATSLNEKARLMSSTARASRSSTLGRGTPKSYQALSVCPVDNRTSRRHQADRPSWALEHESMYLASRHVNPMTGISVRSPITYST